MLSTMRNPSTMVQKGAMRWQSREVTTVVVTSGEMLQQLWSLIPQWYREHWLLRCRLLVVSQRLAKLARELGLARH